MSREKMTESHSL